MGPLNIRPGDRLIKNYYDVLHQHAQFEIDHEGAVRRAFVDVLAGYGKRVEWTLFTEYSYKKVRVDGALLDPWKQRRGFWEAKDAHDDLEKEIRRKIDSGYPTTNIIFQAPERAILYQRGARIGLNENIGDARNLVELLQHFFSYKEPEHEEWDKAVDDFSDRLPEIAKRAKDLIDHERVSNKAFRDRFEEFYALCRRSINPNLTFDAVEEMLIQHLLTERIFRRVFRAGDFSTRNVIAQEIEKVISSLTSRHFSRDAFLSELDRFYKAIERSAEEKSDYAEKQDFLNTVYEEFFQGYSPKEADTHGIVYTPQPIVDFMVRSVEDILKKEFGKSLSDKGVHILDPFVGTGNFIVRIMREMKKSALPYKYENELHCNEVMLLPYYIASMNIEHEYFQQTGEYRAFPGICLVDTFELAETDQGALGFMTEENTARVKRQKESPIFVIIGNPPYNAWQLDVSDNNRKRSYRRLDARISETYGKDSTATNRTALFDTYVKAIRWATDRIGDEGIIAFITNDSFVDEVAFDGFRQHVAKDFSAIYVLDLGGNVRKNPKISGTTHNVFGIQVGVSINLLIRKKGVTSADVHYYRVDDFLPRNLKFTVLERAKDRSAVEWQRIKPQRNVWLTSRSDGVYQSYVAVAVKPKSHEKQSIFELHCRGVCSCRDSWVYNFQKHKLRDNVQRTVDFYNSEVQRWSSRRHENALLDDFISYDDKKISWSRDLKRDLKNGKAADFQDSKIRESFYRPFTKQFLFLDRVLNQDIHYLPAFFPDDNGEIQNRAITVSDVGSQKPFMTMLVNLIPDMHLASPGCSSQVLPFYIYNEDGSNRRENITDWALNEFRTNYEDQKIGKWNVFHYVYGLLHSPEYRERYAANLKRELPRIPFAPDFWAFAKAGERLADLHVNYERQPEYPLERVENPKEKLSYRVEKMRLSKDKSALTYNSFWTLRGIPPETYEYRLGNRSALEWVVDQYQISTDKRSGIVNDPNREDDPEYILRLIGQVIHVSMETVKIVKALPALGIAQSAGAGSKV